MVSGDDRIAGFYTLSADNIGADDLHPEMVKQIKLPRYPVMGPTGFSAAWSATRLSGVRV
jgi:hypothetical protein